MEDVIDLLVFVKLRLALVVGLATGIATCVLGVFNILSTTSLNAFPLYVHVVVGAFVFPLSVFALEYRGIDWTEAVKVGSVFSGLALVSFLLLSEGIGRMANGVFELGVPTLFYVFSVGIVASTVVLVLAERLYLDRSAPTSPFGRR